MEIDRFKRKIWALVPVAVLLISGCGSTVQSDGAIAQRASADQSLGLDNLGGPVALTDQSPLQSAGGPVGLTGESTLQASGSPSYSPEGFPSSAATGTVRPAPTSGKPIELGFIVSDGADSYFGALGLKGLTTGDTRNQANALVAHLNKSGGLLGHQVRAVFYNLDPSTAPDQTVAEACTTFTQDHHVFAVIDPSGLNTLDCLTRAGVIDIATANHQSEAAVKKAAGMFFDPPDLTLERFARTYIDQVVKLGFITGKAKIGLLTYDTPALRQLTDKVIKPELAKRGLSLTAEAAFSESEYAGQGTPFALRFKASGVTHVLNFASGAIVFFQISAQQQGYKPRYAVSSSDGPGAWVQVLAPAEQLVGSIGIGWQPLADVDLKHSPGDVSPNQTLCRKIMQAAGEDMSNQGVQVVSHRYCEGVFFLDFIASHASQFTPSAFRAVVDEIGDSYRSVMTFGTYFAKGRSDGPDKIRPLAFDEACKCFKYTMPAQNLSRTS